MAFSFLINGVEYNCNIFRQSVRIRESLQANGSTLVGTVQPSIGSLTAPLGGQAVQFYRDGVLEFAGRIGSAEKNRNYFTDQYDISCHDWTPDLDSELIQPETIEDDSLRNIALQILGHVGKNFTGTGIAAETPPIKGFDIDYDAPSNILSRIAESVEYQWYIDYNRDLQLFYITDKPAPVTSINFDTDNNGVYSDLEVSEDATQVKNALWLTGGKIKSGNRDLIAVKADGDQRFFPLNYQPTGLSDITVQVNGAYQTLKLDTVEGQAGDGGGSPGDVYVCIDNWGVRFPDTSPPAEDAAVDISYRYVINPAIYVEDPNAIAFMAARENTSFAPSTGKREAKYELPDLGILDNDEAIVDYGSLLLARYAYPVYNIKFKSLTQGWSRGQSLLVNSTNWGFTNMRIYISAVNKSIWQSSGGVAKFMYEIEASNSPFPT